MMMKKTYLMMVFLFLVGCGSLFAQRFTDKLDRGLVAIPTGSTTGSTANLVTWRRLTSEYYDVTYKLYKNGALLAENLTTTCYSDSKSAPPTTEYQVAAVVNGMEQEKCAAVTPWKQYVYKLGNNRYPTASLDIELAAVTDRDGNDVTANYSPNDAEMADLDGDGQLEIIIKRLNTVDASTTGVETGEYETDEDGNYVLDDDGNKIPLLDGELYSALSRQFVVIDAYKINWQTGAAMLLWRIDCGPNMVSLNSTEIDVIAYDWDEDGKAEVVLRGADDMVLHMSDGTTQTVGIEGFNFRESAKFSHKSGGQYAWSHFGREYLVYLNGETGKPYQITDFPLPRLEESEWANLGVSGVAYNDYVALEKAGYGNYFSKNNKSKSGVLYDAWGDNYGHRSTKFFFGAPFLDGRKASLFLGRGIYTRHKMIAMDLDRSSHQWKERWRWNCNDKNSPWYGNGYHNFIVADVDEDGRDEIVYGSMVIDDNGKGLSTTGFEHGDAQHVSDFDPYRRGLEYFGCLEDGPYYGANYRNATTSEVYWKHTGTGDDGRALMGNFSNDYPGSVGRSVSSNMISSLTNSEIEAMAGNSYIAWGKLNQRIYWDGDLCSEILDSPGTAKEASVDKPGSGRIFTSSGCNMNNSSKNNPCFQGDIIGDWREEIVVRQGTNIRVYTSGIGTGYSMPTLWNDHQYRQAMVWQMMAYNQPPHLSYFLGEMEGITVAPPTLTNDGRTEVANGGTIGTTTDHLLMAETNNMTVSVAEGAAPYMLTVNTPTWVQGADVNGTSATKVKSDGSVGVANLPEITTTAYTHTLTGGAFTGSMRLVKQGNGILVLPSVTQTYTGETNVWAGTLQFDGTLQSSPLWLNRFATLLSDGGTFNGGISAEYGASIVPGGENSKGSITTTALTLNHGARLLLDIYGNTKTADQVNIGTLTINTKSGEAWTNYGPQYLKPVIQFVQQGSSLPDGYYDLGALDRVEGDLEDILLEGLDGANDARLAQHNGHLWLVIGNEVAKASAPVIAENGLQRSAAGMMLPVVNITAADFGYLGTTATPSLSATFADVAGNVSAADIRKTLFWNDYESATDASSWENGGGSLQLVTDDATYGNYIYHDINGVLANRSAYMLFDDIDLSAAKHYNIEFDAYLKAGNTANRSATELVVMTMGAVIPTKINVGYGYDGTKCNATGTKYLFRMKAANSQDFTINEQDALMLSADWTHYLIAVNTEARTATYVLTRGSEELARGTFSIPEGTSAEPYGLFILDGRGYGKTYLDNIRIYSTDDYEYTFQQPGTLTVTSSYSGCESTTASYTGAVVLDENDTMAPVATGGEVPVKVIRSIGADEWSTICLPFDMTVEQWQSAFGSDAEIRSLTGYTKSGSNVKVVFSSPVTGALAKNTPYIIKTKNAISDFTATVEIAPAAATATVTDGSMVGVYQAQTVIPASHFFLSGNQFYRSMGLTKSKAYRAYFWSKAAEESSARLMMDLDVQTTGIKAVGKQTGEAPLYDMQGRIVMEPSAKKGIYIQDGKKVVKK